MGKKILKIITFCCVIVLLDRITGTSLKVLFNNTNDYNISKLRYTLNSTDQDVLILGSSRAVHHYIPDVCEQITGMRTYNCGFDGQGLLFSFIQLQESLKRYCPKIIVIDVSPNILLDPLSKEKLKVMLPFYQNDTFIYNVLSNREPLEKIKFISSIYPYNSTVFSILKGYFKILKKDSLKGFLPLTGMIDTTGLTQKIITGFPKIIIPNEKFTDLNAIVNLCNEKQVPAVIVVGPVYQTNEYLDQTIEQIKMKCRLFDNLYFFDFSKYPGIHKNKKLFQDNLHLNQYGAKIFSEVLSLKLKAILGHEI